MKTLKIFVCDTIQVSGVKYKTPRPITFTSLLEEVIRVFKVSIQLLSRPPTVYNLMELVPGAFLASGFDSIVRTLTIETRYGYTS